MEKTINWHSQLLKLQSFCNDIGYSVYYEKVPEFISYIDFSNKKIVIHNGQNIERQFYSLLHEIGHDLFWKEKKYNTIEYVRNNFCSTSNINKIALIEEEIGAWQEATELIKNKKYKINKKNFQRFKSEALMTYIKWAASI